MNAVPASGALSLTLVLSTSGGEGIETAPSPSPRERVGMRVGASLHIIRACPLLTGKREVKKELPI
jgi:hypothetical protein